MARKNIVERLLLDTKAGDAALKAFEKASGLGVVRLEEIEGEQAGATQRGRELVRPPNRKHGNDGRLD